MPVSPDSQCRQIADAARWAMSLTRQCNAVKALTPAEETQRDINSCQRKRAIKVSPPVRRVIHDVIVTGGQSGDHEEKKGCDVNATTNGHGKSKHRQCKD